MLTSSQALLVMACRCVEAQSCRGATLHRHVIQADLTWLSPAKCTIHWQCTCRHNSADASCTCWVLIKPVSQSQSFVKGGKDAVPIEGVKLSQLICQTRTGRLYRGTLKGVLVHIKVHCRHACT